MLLGQVMLGGWPVPSMTRTSNEQYATWPQPFVARQITVVTPSGKQEPDGGLQLSSAPLLTVGFEYVTFTQFDPQGATVTMLLGH